jgi:precorrin-6B methylase 2
VAGPLTAAYAKAVRDMVAAWPAEPSIDELNRTLRRLGHWRSLVLAQTCMNRAGGPRIVGGPFAGMEYVSRATEGALVPRLLGTYESELHPHLRRLAAAELDCVIDIGCAEGYYAVGLARMMPGVAVHAYDTDEHAREACAELAARNGVADRVVIGGEFAPDGFEAFAGRRALVIVDIEGAEVDVLRPDLSPALRGMHLIVETHDIYRAGALAELVRRFSSTHEIVREDQQAKILDPMPGWLAELGHLDQLLAVWEWRFAPTPWLVMTPRG